MYLLGSTVSSGSSFPAVDVFLETFVRWSWPQEELEKIAHETERNTKRDEILKKGRDTEADPPAHLVVLRCFLLRTSRRRK
jgi:hypothetical protein